MAYENFGFLKKCPFCGGNSDILQYYNRKQNTFFVYVQCGVCGSRGKTSSCGRGNPAPSELDWECPAVDRSVMAWNMRYKEEEHAE